MQSASILPVKNCTITVFYAALEDQKISNREEINATPKDTAKIIK